MENQKKADLVKRFIAAVIDGVLASIVAIIPVVGALVGAAYTLSKDGIMFQVTKDVQWKNRSVGKKVMGLEVVTADGSDVDIKASCMRNWPLAIGTVIMIVPILGWIIGGIVGMVLGIIELILVLTDSQGRRFGDKFGKTMVIESAATEVSA